MPDRDATKWKETPTKPGWYWWYYKKTKQLNIFEIRKLKSGKLFAVGIDTDYEPRFWALPAYWLGPIPIPDRPE